MTEILSNPARNALLPTALVAGLFLSLLLGPAGCTPETSTASADTTQPEDALRQVDQQLRYTPTDPMLWAERAELMHQRGQHDTAVANMRTAIRHDTLFKFPEYRQRLGFFFYALAQDDSAEKYYNLALNMGSQSPETFYQLGNLMTLRGQYAQAIQHYNSALANFPREPIYHFGKGYAYRRMGELGKAQQSLEMSLQYDPNFLKSLAELAELHLLDLKDEAAAARYVDRILAADSAGPLGPFYQAELYLANALKGNHTEAQRRVLLRSCLTPYNVALERDPNFARAYYSRGYVYFELDDFGKAMPDFQNAARLNPRDFRAEFMLGSLYEHYQDAPNARLHYQRALDLNPRFAEASQALAELEGR
jgi:tetratricopeptide (TPR) repeat protein